CGPSRSGSHNTARRGPGGSASRRNPCRIPAPRRRDSPATPTRHTASGSSYQQYPERRTKIRSSPGDLPLTIVPRDSVGDVDGFPISHNFIELSNNYLHVGLGDCRRLPLGSQLPSSPSKTIPRMSSVQSAPHFGLRPLDFLHNQQI